MFARRLEQGTIALIFWVFFFMFVEVYISYFKSRVLDLDLFLLFFFSGFYAFCMFKLVVSLSRFRDEFLGSLL